MALAPDIAAYYERGDEGERLTTLGRLEFLRTVDVLSRVLPDAPATVHDIGGAEGIYALPLAAGGYTVTLLDPVERHVAAARDASLRADAPLAAALVGDARELPFDDDSADALLLLGPLYHLVDADDRIRALTEARRVLRPGGRVVGATISRFASLADGIDRDMLTDEAIGAMITDDLRTGVHRNPDPDRHPRWFTLAYFHRPEELAAELEAAGFVDIGLYVVEGLGAAAPPDMIDDPARRAALLQALITTEREPSLLGASPHLLGVATAP